MTNPIDIQVNGHRATVTLRRPEVRNAFNDETIAQLAQAFETLGARADLRCIVLAADGPAFCAGADLNYMKRMSGFGFDDNLADARRLAGMLNTIHACPIPTVARIQGDVFAGGMGLVAACDIAVTVDSARFCLSEVNLGLVPATIGPFVLRAMGARAAHRYFLTGERFSAAEALRIGFVHESVPVAQLDDTVERVVGALLNAGPAATRSAKAFVRDVAGRAIDAALIESTARSIAELRGSDEGREGIRSFLEKRSPAWRGNAS